MSGNFRTFKLPGGGYADVPEENVEKWLQRMEQRGINGIDVAEPQADMQVGEPEVIKTPRQQFGASGGWDAPEPQQPSMVDRFLETGSDAVRGGLRGLTMGYGDKLEAGMRSMLPGGGSYADEFAKQNQYQDAAASRSPYAYNISKTLGGAPYDLGAAIAGAPGGLGGEMATSGVLGQLRGAGMSRSPTLEGTLEDANRGGAEGAAWGLGGGLAGRFLAAGSDALTSLSPKARGAAMGELGSAAKAARKAKGDDFIEGLPQAADELGLTPRVPMDWRHPVDSLKQKLTFKSPGDYATQAQSLMDDVHGPAKADAVRAATAEGVSIPRDELIGAMGDQIAAQPRNYKAAPYEAAMERNMTDVPPGLYSPGAPLQLGPQQLDKLKMDWAKAGYRGPDEVMTLSEAIPARASRDASNIAGARLGDAIDQMALPETATAYRGANDAYEKSASIANMARQKQLDLDTQGPFSLPNMGRTFGAGAGGATLGAQVAGVPGAIVGGVGGILSNKAIQNYGPDMVADFLRSGPARMHPSTPAGAYDATTGNFQSLPFGAPGGGLRDAAIGGTIGGMAAGPAGAVGGAALGAMGRPGMQAATGAGQAITGSRDRYEDPGAAAQRDIESGRGYMLTDAVMDMLRNDPQSLGPYASQFGQAMGAGDNEQDSISTLITRLSKTDPNFRTQVLPAIRARTGGM
jgi:hypothetical protein